MIVGHKVSEDIEGWVYLLEKADSMMLTLAVAAVLAGLMVLHHLAL